MNLSYSQLSLLKKCPSAWYRRYIQKDYGEPVNHLFLEGSVLHKLNEHFLTLPFPNVVTALGKAHEIFVSEANKLNLQDFTFGDPALIFARISESFSKLVKMERDLNILSSPERKLEVPFNIPIGNTKCNLIGYIDLIYKDGNGNVVIADFKNSDNDKFADPLQLQLYDMVYMTLKGIKPLRTFFIIVKAEKISEHDFKEDSHAVTKQYLIDVVADINNRLASITNGTLSSSAFPTKPEYMSCKYCAYRNSCLQSMTKNSNVSDIINGELIL